MTGARLGHGPAGPSARDPARTRAYPWRREIAPRRAPLAALLLGLAVALGGLPTMAPPAAAAADFRLELGRRADFVAQTNLVQCVGASMQMMINIMAPQDDRTAVTQHRLWTLARALGPSPPAGFRGKGASPIGWARGLDRLWLRPVCGRRLPDLGERSRRPPRRSG